MQYNNHVDLVNGETEISKGLTTSETTMLTSTCDLPTWNMHAHNISANSWLSALFFFKANAQKNTFVFFQYRNNEI